MKASDFIFNDTRSHNYTTGLFPSFEHSPEQFQSNKEGFVFGEDLYAETLRTLSVAVPSRYSFFTQQEMLKGVPTDREVFRNKTDQIFSYQFEDTSHLRLIILSNSPGSRFELGVELSLFSTVDTR